MNDSLFARTFGLCLVLLLGGSAAIAEQGSPPTVLRIGYQLSSTLTTILKINGALEKALAPLGVQVTWHEFTSGLPQLEALNTGNIDFSADVADTVPIFAIAAGAKLTYVAEEAPSPQAQAILVPANSTIRTTADLKGKSVAVTKGAGSHYLLIAALSKANLTFKDISPAYLTPADGRAGFVGNSVAAWVAWDPYLTAAERQNGAKVLIDGAGLANYKRYYLASQTYAHEHSDVLKVVYDQLVGTGEWVKQHPDEAAAQLAGIWHIEKEIVEEANNHRSYAVGLVTKDGLAEQKKIAAAFYGAGLLPRPVDGTEAEIWQP
jgi:sulfonate transport system substrate-binding protein